MVHDSAIKSNLRTLNGVDVLGEILGHDQMYLFGHELVFLGNDSGNVGPLFLPTLIDANHAALLLEGRLCKKLDRAFSCEFRHIFKMYSISIDINQISRI